MAYRRRRARRGRYNLSTNIRSYLIGFLWLGIGLAVIGAIAGLSSVLPSQTISIGSGTNAIQIESSLFYNVIGFAIGIVFMLNAVRRLLKVRL